VLNATWLRGSGKGCEEVVNAARDHHLSAMKILELSDVEAEALARELAWIVDGDRYPLSPRIQTLRAILARLRPEPARLAASPQPRVYAPPSRGRYRRRSG
jgi:hypothetical protein